MRVDEMRVDDVASNNFLALLCLLVVHVHGLVQG